LHILTYNTHSWWHLLWSGLWWCHSQTRRSCVSRLLSNGQLCPIQNIYICVHHGTHSPVCGYR